MDPVEGGEGGIVLAGSHHVAALHEAFADRVGTIAICDLPLSAAADTLMLPPAVMSIVIALLSISLGSPKTPLRKKG